MSRECVSPLSAGIVLLAVLCVPAAGQEARARETLYEVVLPGGLARAQSVLDDPTSPDRAQFLVEVIRRFHSSLIAAQPASQVVRYRALLAHLDAASRASAADVAPTTLPLPLPPDIWIETVFGGNATPATLVSDILKSRHASLLYCALLSVDAETRHWLAGQPKLLGILSTTHAAAFVVAAPGLRVRDGRVQVPGGASAEPVCRQLTGATVDDPAAFILGLLRAREGRTAYMFAAMSQLSDMQVRVAFKLDVPDRERRLIAARRLHRAFERAALQWTLDRLPFWRPSTDPAVLISELATNERGEPTVPGDTAFWTAVLEAPAPKDEAAAPGDPVEIDWLCERVFNHAPHERARRYGMLLFAIRTLDGLTRDTRETAIEVVRAAAAFPALTSALERAGLRDLSAFVKAARRAAALTRIEDRERATRALLQFQGALAAVTRAVRRGGFDPGTLPDLISSLSDVEVSARGDYEGRLVSWIATTFNDQSTGGIEAHVRRRLAGSFAVEPGFVEWEGMTYRVDPAAPEAKRLDRLLGDAEPGFFAAARALVRVADRIAGNDVAADRFPSGVEELLEDGRASEYRDIVAAVRRGVNASTTARYAQDLRILADGLLARGLLHLAYATAFGQPGTASISLIEAASRHELGGDREFRTAWQLPEAGSFDQRQWHVRGSLLGLDVRLAQFSLTRVSARPPTRPPSLNEIDRRAFTQVINLVEPAALNDAGLQVLTAALRRGRGRVEDASMPADVLALANELQLSPVRRTLLAWTAVHERERVLASFSLGELMWLGAERTTPNAAFNSWGAPGESRLGCLCLRLDRRSWDPLAGRGTAGYVASGFPDLNLRLAELLAELRMPAVLFAHVLAPATLDLVENAASRDHGDHRGLSEFVRTLTVERLEEYLALLTTDGPLVPADAAEVAAAVKRRP